MERRGLRTLCGEGWGTGDGRRWLWGRDTSPDRRPLRRVSDAAVVAGDDGDCEGAVENGFRRPRG